VIAFSKDEQGFWQLFRIERSRRTFERSTDADE